MKERLKVKDGKNLTAEEKNLKAMSNATNYNKWLFNNIRKHVGERVLEIGGGVGNMTRLFLSEKVVVSTDVSDYNISVLKHRFRDRKNFTAVKNDISKSCAELKGSSFDTVVCINVLEHIRDDVAALKNMGGVLSRKGKLVLLVPAFSSLYGTIDKSDNHYRRYDRKSTIKKVENAGYRVIKSYYMNIPGFFGWYYHGRVIRAKLHPEGDISLFDRLVPVFEFFEKIFKPPFGLSLIIIAEKK